jgi:Cu2+-exporting ATPase
MKFSIRHAIPGRIRLQCDLLARKTKTSEAVVARLEEQEWVRSARINYDCASLTVVYDPGQSGLMDLLLAFLRGASLDDVRAFVAEPTTVAGKATVRQQSAPAVSKDVPLLWPTVSLGMAFTVNPLAVAANVPLMLWNSLPIFKRAWKVWSTESRLNVDFLDTLAILASMGQGNLMTGGIIVWLIRLGDWIRDLTAAGSKRAVSELLEFQAKSAWLLADGQVVSVPAADLKPEDIVMVYHGEMIPVDGEIVDGHAQVDQKTITGESLPVNRSRGDAAFAATVIREGQLTIRATRVGSQTTAGQIAELVDGAPIGDTRMQNHAERFADRLVVPTLSLAVGASVLSADFNRFLSCVIVDYGTGIRVAAPTSILSSMTHAARAGIIIKSGGHMEKLAGIDTIVFDKTGTLTEGVPAVREVLTYSNHIGPEHLLALAAAAETKLKHPVADALRAKAQEWKLDIPPCDEATYKVGMGVEGQVNGYYVHVGRERYLTESGIKVDLSAADRQALNERGESCMYVAVDGKLTGLVSYADRIRAESRQVVETLTRMGIKNTLMLTGDNAVVARAVGRQLGLSGHVADMLPSDKAEAIQELQRQGRIVAMVGDGINDSPALAFADVGIAMKHGADITHESADVVLMEDSLWKLVKAIEISRGGVRLIKQNYGIVAALNTVALGMALPGGLITPEATAVLSNGSAILASLNGMRPILRYQ